jgi:hypothetical protein
MGRKENEINSLSTGLALSACILTITNSAGFPKNPAIPPAILPANAILYPGIGVGSGISVIFLPLYTGK